MRPPAPPRFSSTNCWPNFSLRASPMTRPTVSDEPPAANGETMRTARVGQSCADTGAPSASNALSDAKTNRRFIAAPSGLRDLAGVELEHLVEAPARDLAAG